ARVMRERTSTSDGSTSEAPGWSRTSSKVSASRRRPSEFVAIADSTCPGRPAQAAHKTPRNRVGMGRYHGKAPRKSDSGVMARATARADSEGTERSAKCCRPYLCRTCNGRGKYVDQFRFEIARSGPVWLYRDAKSGLEDSVQGRSAIRWLLAAAALLQAWALT